MLSWFFFPQEASEMVDPCAPQRSEVARCQSRETRGARGRALVAISLSSTFVVQGNQHALACRNAARDVPAATG